MKKFEVYVTLRDEGLHFTISAPTIIKAMDEAKRRWRKHKVYPVGLRINQDMTNEDWFAGMCGNCGREIWLSKGEKLIKPLCRKCNPNLVNEKPKRL